ncbi:DNA helicase, partial [Haemophilus parahaemolyticus]|uniref:DnaB-like helicase C-terminal domain-containing protein n=1 Tax=Haemophilus parahaemolyticus TaxID=735 RepID=UPI00352F2C41
QVGKPAVLVIDYIGLVSHGALDGRVNRTYQIAESMNKLKAWLKDNRIPTVLLSQLNRNADDTRPTLGELRDSGSLEQDASQVILVHNARNKKDNEPNRYTEWIIAKNRHGRMGTVYMEFKYGQFWECDQAMAWESFQKPQQSTGGKKYGN